MAVEIEKKYRLTEELRSAVVSELAEMGAEHVGEDLEENIIFGNETLKASGAVLRVRRTQDKTLLTYKQRIENPSDIKHQNEEETEVGDAEIILRILELSGFEKRLIYEKRRRTWRFRETEVVIDELPFGLYMEIEGSITAIREAEMLLDIEDIEVVNETYPRLTAMLGKKIGGIIESRF